MKLILLSDLHLVAKNPDCRKDDLFIKQFDKLKFIFDCAVKNDAIILQAGDFFDKPNSIHVLQKIVEILNSYIYTQTDFNIFGIYGQHDLSNRNKNGTCLSLLESFYNDDIVYVNYEVLVNDPILFDHNVYIYGCSFGEKIPIVKDKNNFNILIIHHPISDCKIVGMKAQNHKEFLRKHKNYDLILCGDIHKKFFYRDENDRIICNTGPMNRKVQDLKDHSPGFWLFDTDTKKEKWIEIPHEKDVFKKDQRTEKKENIQKLENFTKKIREFTESVKKTETRRVDIENKLLILFEEYDIDNFVREVLLRIIDFDKKENMR